MTFSTGHHVERIPVTQLRNGHALELAVHTLQGAEDGPQLTMFGGIHGDEPLGSEAVRRVLGTIDPNKLKGRIVAVPVANPYAYAAQTRTTPGDGFNLNRTFPGDAQGFLSEKLAATLTEILLDGTTHFVDHHSGGNYACVDYTYIHDNGADMSKAFGCRILYSHDTYPHTTTEIALEHGIPSLVTEIGGGLQDTERYMTKFVDGTLNVMRAIGMLDEALTPPPADQIIVETLIIVKPQFGGVLLAEVDASRLGETVPKGTVLGRIVDPYSFEELEVLKAPYEETIMVLSRCPVTICDPGDYGFMVADGATARPAN